MGISIWQIVLVLVIILILFGAGKIPRVMGDVAKGIKSFKKEYANIRYWSKHWILFINPTKSYREEE